MLTPQIHTDALLAWVRIVQEEIEDTGVDDGSGNWDPRVDICDAFRIDDTVMDHWEIMSAHHGTNPVGVVGLMSLALMAGRIETARELIDL